MAENRKRMSSGRRTLALALALAGCSAPAEETVPASLGDFDVAEPLVSVVAPRPEEPYPTEPELLAEVPAIYGGTMLATADGARLVVSDPARDTVTVLTTDMSELRRVDLEAGSEPFRATEDGEGRVHVVLRGSGELLTLDATLENVVRRTAVCPAPRGVAFDESAGALRVACKNGELVTLGLDGAERSRVFVDTDLRDVVIADGVLHVTRFRSAELLTLAADGSVLHRRRPATATSRMEGQDLLEMAPTVAWRARGLPDGSVLMLHQRSAATPIALREDPTGSDGPSGSYGTRPRDDGPEATCIEPVVQMSVTHFAPGDGAPLHGPMLANVGLAVDLAVDPSGRRFAVTTPIDGRERDAFRLPVFGPTDSETSMSKTTVYALHVARTSLSETRCAQPLSATDGGSALAWTEGGLFVHQREPSLVARAADDGELLGWVHLDPRTAIDSPGQAIFHQVTPLALACASCHPEGDEDGHTWFFDEDPGRRTQTMRGGILSTLPFHWRGDVADLRAVMRTTFSTRMQGPAVSASEVDDLEAWIDRLPPLPAPPLDAAVVAAGEAIFAERGCADCHSGASLTNNETVTVHEGAEPLQVPMLLGVGHRAPYFHDGCAKELRETFDGTCSPGHVPTGELTEDETAALATYLRSL
jgi:mono/diheme cytochrome c family protein